MKRENWFETIALVGKAGYGEHLYSRICRFLSFVLTMLPSALFPAITSLCSEDGSGANNSCRTRPSKVHGKGRPIVLSTVGTRSKISASGALKLRLNGAP